MRTSLTSALVAMVALVVSCGGSEQTILKNFFDAVQVGDENAAKRVSLVEFPEEVSTWEIVEVGTPSNEPFGLGELHTRLLELRDEIESAERLDQNFLEANLEVYETYRARKSEDPDQEFTGELAAFDSELKSRLAKQEDLNKEQESLQEQIKSLKEAATLSLNTAVNERFSGEVEGKELRLKVNDKDYTFMLKRYVLEDTERNIAPIARWIITDIVEQEA